VSVSFMCLRKKVKTNFENSSEDETVECVDDGMCKYTIVSSNEVNGCATHSLSENVLFLLYRGSLLLLPEAEARLCFAEYLDFNSDLGSFGMSQTTKS
jgi:hypothetical protein